MNNIHELVEKQRKYFQNGNTLNLNNRVNLLIEIKERILLYQNNLLNAFIKDFNKSEFDVYSTELSVTLLELDFMIKNIKKLLKPKRAKTNLINFPSKSYIYKEPYGVTLVIAPWNYPFQLAVLPLIDAVACGNTVVVKPSEYAPNVASVVEEIFSTFNEHIIKVVNGDVEVANALLQERFDLIFYTGSTRVGKIIMEQASKHLTPVILELGGKSPCIVDKEVDLDVAVKRIVWGKFINAGQTCVSPDYILVHKDIHEKFLKKVIKQVKKYYYDNIFIDKDFTHIINERHLHRLLNLIDEEKLVFGGKHQGNLLEPTILDNVTEDDKIMQEEIFGPIMPIIEYENIDDVINIIKTKERPLALYIFSKNKTNIDKVIKNLSFGGGCINDVIMHVTNEYLPFGGVGNSGMGRYHGKYSIDAFTYTKSIFKKGKFEPPVKYPKYSTFKLKLLKFFTKQNRPKN